ncbi:MAG: 3-hydroxybutyryl-CoA dehydrogenase [Saprospiraceae bacterium]|jgi:3-hydroxybutyryl-CoA dehydrogenase|nr:3-hydroxybutyryl-CoA dehydrogenase [Saprospiraceae bacterium]
MTQIAVIGAGTMGAGIAQVALMSGCEVILVDANKDVLDKAHSRISNNFVSLREKGKMDIEQSVMFLEKLHCTDKIEACGQASLVIEAIVENLEIKKNLFNQLESIVSADCILASNTSSLSITSIAGTTKNPGRVIGIHFFNPANLMKLVEVIPAIQTDLTVVNKVMDLIRSWNKITVLAKDTPGFIVNRIARPYYSEAIRIFEEGIADIATIDLAMTKIAGFKMGPFTLMDFIGHDVNYAVTESVWTACYYEPRYRPSFTQKRLVEAGFLGKKSGRGFYNYAEGAEHPKADEDESLLENIANRILVMLFNEAADALHFGIATRDDIETAMTTGVNYPKGLLAWAEEWGIDNCIAKMEELHAYYQEPRYRCSPGLRGAV